MAEVEHVHVCSKCSSPYDFCLYESRCIPKKGSLNVRKGFENRNEGHNYFA